MGTIPADLSAHPTPFAGNPPVKTNIQELPYGQLTWEDFERLCLRLAQSETKVEECRRYGAQGDEQEGIDIYAVNGNSVKYSVYQCKKVRKFGPKKIKAAVELFLLGDWATKSDTFVLCSQESMSSRLREDEIQNQRVNLLGKGIQLKIWDSNGLDTRLKHHPEIVFDFFGEHWPKAFCGSDAVDLPNKLSKAKKKVFAPPEEYIPRTVFQTGTQELKGPIAVGEPLRDVLKKQSKIVLLGNAGTGKSIELQKLLSDLSSHGEVLWPFQIKLAQYSDRKIRDYIALQNDFLGNSVLCIDGLDEVQGGTFERMRRKISEFATEFPNVRIIVTCRSNFYITSGNDQQLNTLPGFTSFQLASLSPIDVDKYLTTKLDDKKDQFLQEVNNKHLWNLLQIPYYLSRLSGQYLNNGQVPSTKAELFEGVVKEGIKKDVARYFPDLRIQKEKEMSSLLERLAFLLEYQGKNTCQDSDLPSIFNEPELTVIKCAGSLLHASEDSPIWQFSHNNVQEYLAARVTSRLQFSQVKTLLAFRPKFNRIKPSWVNTLSFLITILPDDSSLRSQLLFWLIQSAPELLVKFEPDRLDENTRHQVFEDIVLYYKQDGRVINRAKFNSGQLMMFSTTEKSIDFLITEMIPSEPMFSRKSALDLISYCTGSILAKEQREKVKVLVEQILFSQRTESELIYLAMKAYIKLFKLSDAEFDKLLRSVQAEEDTFVRYVLFHAVHSQGQQDRHVDFVLAEISKLMAVEFGNADSGRLGNEYEELKECVRKAESLVSLEKILDFIAGDTGRVLYSISFHEIVETTLNRVSSLFPDSTSLCNRVIAIYTSEELHLDDNNSEIFLKYFKSAGQVDRAFKSVYSGIKNPPDYYSLHSLSKLIDDDSVRFLVNEFKIGKLTRHFVEQFQYYLQPASSILSQFNIGINEKEMIPLPAARNIDNGLVDRIKSTKEILFDKDRFKAALEKVFIDQKKDELNYDEVWEIRKDYRKYPPDIHETIKLFDPNRTVKRGNLLAYIDSNWDDFSMARVVEFMKEFPTTELSEAELGIVKTWCDQAASKVDFKNALVHPTADRTTANRVAVKLSFLIRKLRLTGYPKSLYLDLLSFQKWDDNEIDIFSFVESLVDNNSIAEQVLLNLSAGIAYYAVLGSHLDYCRRLNLRQATPSLIKYLTDNDHQRHEVLDAYVALGGDIGSLEMILPRVSGHFRFYFYQTLILKSAPGITRYLTDSFRREKDEESRLRLAELLIELQVGEALRYYIGSIRRTKTVPGDSSPSNPFYKVYDIRLIRYVFQLYELSFDKTIRQDNFNRLSDIAVGALQGICLYESNLPKVKFIFTIYKMYFSFLKYTLLGRVPTEIIPNLAFYFENFEQQYYVNKGSNVSLKDALKILPLLQRET